MKRPEHAKGAGTGRPVGVRGGGRLLGGATGLLDRHTFVGTPKAPEGKGRVRLVDVNGSGTRDISWGEDFSYKRLNPRPESRAPCSRA